MNPKLRGRSRISGKVVHKCKGVGGNPLLILSKLVSPNYFILIG